MIKTIMAFTGLFLLVACGGFTFPLLVSTPLGSPSSLPAILSPTPPLIPSATATRTAIPLNYTLTKAPSSIPAKTTATFTPTPGLLLDILGCKTSLDITHQMGEVTNAYPIIRNNTGNELTNVCATLTASDEARLHPDKTSCIVSLPNGYQATLKLTVDTGFKQDTSIRVDVTSNEGSTLSLARSSCRDLGLPGWVPDKIGVVEPIP
jgi:hypothetical protein